MVNKLT